LTDGDRLLAAILDNPADDGLRLIYADWLEENAVALPCPECNGKGKKSYRAAGPFGGVFDCKGCGGRGRVSNGNAERAELIGLTAETLLLDNDGPRWHLNRDWPSMACEVAVNGLLPIPKADRRCLAYIRYGFIDRLAGSFDWLTHHLGAIVRRHPLRPHAGMVTDREPFEWNTVFVWRSDRAHIRHPDDTAGEIVSEDVFAVMWKQNCEEWRSRPDSIYFPTRNAAMLALAMAMIEYARRESKL
jgi:uncharacterized protein (TIGR02996 family)